MLDSESRKKRKKRTITADEEKQVEQLVTFLWEEDALGYNVVCELLGERAPNED